MGAMPTTLDWTDVLVRLALATLAGAAVGLNRSESGKAAGLRTTLLVCLAACLAMLQVNVLLGQAGKAADSFVDLDLMRLPLGILSGVGFIGAGVILRRDGLVVGVTTAATLWFVTVIGLCFGGGQLALGAIGLVLGVAILWGLRVVENRLPREQSALLTVEYDLDTDYREHLVRNLHQAGCRAGPKELRLKMAERTCRESFEVSWRSRNNLDVMTSLLTESAVAAGAKSVSWSLGE
jgi:putative Mg2+ transporter-C (MgtC) family protein